MASNVYQLLFAAVRAWVAAVYPGYVCVEIKLKLAPKGRVILPVPPGVVEPEKKEGDKSTGRRGQ